MSAQNILLICGTLTQTKAMLAIGEQLDDHHCYYTPFYCDGHLLAASKKGWLDFTAVAGPLRERTMGHLRDARVAIDDRGEGRTYDLVITCTDLVIQQNIKGQRIVLVQEGLTEPEGLLYWMVKHLGVPRVFANTAAFGLSDEYEVFCVASDGARELFLRKGIRPEKMVVTGIPNFDNVRTYLDNDFPHRNYVLVCTSNARETFKRDNRMRFLRRAIAIAGTRPILFKLHPAERHDRAIREITSLVADPLIYRDGNCEHMIANSTAVVAQSLHCRVHRDRVGQGGTLVHRSGRAEADPPIAERRPVGTADRRCVPRPRGVESSESRDGWMDKASTDQRHWLLMLGGFALLGVLFLQLRPGPILALFGTMGANLVVIIGIFLVHEVVRAIALGRCLPTDARISLWRLTWVQCLGEAVRALTHTGPLVSEPARGWMLARHGVDGAHAYAAAVSELIANSCISAVVTILVLGFALMAMPLGPKLAVLSHVLLWLSLAWVLIVAIGLTFRIYIIGTILGRMGSLPFIGTRVRTDPMQVRRMEDAILRVLRDRPTIMVQVVVLEFVAQALLIFDTYWVFRSMELPVSMTRTLLVEALTKLANFIQLVGATEGAYVVVFEWLGMTAAVGFALSLVKRVRSLVIAGLSLLLMVWIDRRMWTVATARHSPPS